MKLVIELNTEEITQKDAAIVHAIAAISDGTIGISAVKEPVDVPAGPQKEVPVEAPEVIEEIPEEKVEEPKEVKPEKKSTKKTPKTKALDVVVELDPTPEVAEKKTSKEVDASSMTAAELNDFAKSVVKPEYAKHYLALLKELGVAKFSLVPADKISLAYNKILEIQKNVVV